MQKLRDKNVFIFDVDGVIFAGSRLISGAKETIEFLRNLDKRVVFLSNNSTQSRRIYMKKFLKAGIDVKKEDFMLATTATASYISRRKPDARILTTGETGLKEELREKGLKVVNNPEECEFLVAASNRKITYEIFTRALRACLRKDVEYIAVNPDKVVPAEDGVVPGTGLVIGALYWLTGRKPKVIGKPSPLIVKELLKKLDVRKDECVIIGDQPGIDIKVANKLGITSILVLSGAVNEKEWKVVCKREKVKPDIVLKNVREIKKYV